MTESTYDLIIVGSGFSSAFFLREYLANSGNKSKVLVLERGSNNSHKWQRSNFANSNIDFYSTYKTEGFRKKNWMFNIGFGGSSNCWSGCTPRMLPSDFKTQSLYNVGTDWPVTYDELEKYYTEVENIMKISGPDDYTLSHRSEKFPLPPHRFNAPDQLLKKAFPDHYYIQATARPSKPVDGRNPCCASSICHLCPMDAKFSILNGFECFDDPRVTLICDAEVQKLNTTKGIAQSVVWQKNSNVKLSYAENIVLAANAMFNPILLKRSGFENPLIGRYLNEQISKTAKVYLDGVDNFSGSTLITGQGYMFYDGEFRKDHAGCIIEHFNRPRFRTDQNRYREVMELKFIFEDLPSSENEVIEVDGQITAKYLGYSDYTARGLDKIEEYINIMGQALPIESYKINEQINSTEAHIQGTARMANTYDKGVVNKYSQVFESPNVFVLGSSAFPTCPAANPTLTLSSLAIMSARSIC